MTTRIPPGEYRQRFERLQRCVADAGLDLFIVTSLDSIYYLTGAGFEPLERPFFLLVRPETEAFLLVPKLDQEHMKKAQNVPEEHVHTYWEYPAPPERSWPARLHIEIGASREIGIEPSLRQEIAQQLGDYSVRMEPLVERLRLVKSAAEIDLIRRAARYADYGVQRLLAASYFGSTVAAGFAETRSVTSRIIRETDDWDPLASRVVMATWAAPRSAMPHSIPSLVDRLGQGPHVALVLTRVNGYAAESERTYFTAPPSADCRAMFSAMMEARRIAFAMLRPGQPCGELDAAVSEYLTRQGFGDEHQRLHRTGHGIGLGTHEGPWLAEGSDDRLAEGIVVSIEPAIYLPGVGGVRHSDTVLITHAGHELLTRLPVDLEEMIIRGHRPLSRLRGRLVRRALALARKEATASPLQPPGRCVMPGHSAQQTPHRGRRLLRRAILLAVVPVLILSAVLAFNAERLRRQSRQMTESPVTIEVDSQRTAEILAEFISVPSYSIANRSAPEDSQEVLEAERQFLELHDLLQQRFPEAHRVLHRETVGDLSLLYRWEGTDGSLEPILLMSHLDVVPVEEASQGEWKYPGSEGTVADGFVWGRGALDVKCGVIGIMAALENLVADGFTLRRTIYLAFGHDEEIGGREGNAMIARHFADQGVRLAFVLDEGGAILDGVVPGTPRPVAFVAIAEKHIANLSITARGEGGHGSMPGRSAVINLAEMIQRIEADPMPARIPGPTESLLSFLGPEMPFLHRLMIGNRWLTERLITSQFSRSPSTSAVVRTTLNVTQVWTETAENQTPSVAWATINVRLLPGDTAEQARDYLLRLTDDLRLKNGQPAIEVKIERAGTSQAVSPVDSAEFRALQQTIHQVFPDVLVAAGLTAGGTDSKWYHDVTDKIYRFIPMRLAPEDIARIHGVNERIGVENLGEIVRFYIQMIRNTAGAG